MISRRKLLDKLVNEKSVAPRQWNCRSISRSTFVGDGLAYVWYNPTTAYMVRVIEYPDKGIWKTKEYAPPKGGPAPGPKMNERKFPSRVKALRTAIDWMKSGY